MKQTECPHDHLDCSLPNDLERLQAEREKPRNLVIVDELTVGAVTCDLPESGKLLP